MDEVKFDLLINSQSIWFDFGIYVFHLAPNLHVGTAEINHRRLQQKCGSNGGRINFATCYRRNGTGVPATPHDHGGSQIGSEVSAGENATGSSPIWGEENEDGRFKSPDGDRTARMHLPDVSSIQSQIGDGQGGIHLSGDRFWKCQ